MEGKTVVYDASVHHITVNGQQDENGNYLTQYYDIVTVSYSITPYGQSSIEGENGAKDVHVDAYGQVSYYTVNAFIDGGGNYNALTLSAQLIITPAYITNIALTGGGNYVYCGNKYSIRIDDGDSDYESNYTQYGDSVNATFLMTPADHALPDVFDGAISVGEYSFTVTINSPESPNYNKNYFSLTLNENLVITPADMFNPVAWDTEFYFEGENGSKEIVITYDSYLHYLSVMAAKTSGLVTENLPLICR